MLQPGVVGGLDRIGHAHRDRFQVGGTGVGELPAEQARAGVPVPVDYRSADVDAPGHGVLAGRPAEHRSCQRARAASPPGGGKEPVGQPRRTVGDLPDLGGGNRGRGGGRVPRGVRGRGQRGRPGHRWHLGDLLDEPGDEDQNPGRDDRQQPQHRLPPPSAAPAPPRGRAVTRPRARGAAGIVPAPAARAGRQRLHMARVNGIYPANEELGGYPYRFVDCGSHAQAVAGVGSGPASSARTCAQPNTRWATKPKASATSTPRLA